ncbi:MAG: hypothetical protein HKN47_10860 [Pirellulaceae bacterium]|nr:hypothetical protein [Pirellulaceae bacterium]
MADLLLQLNAPVILWPMFVASIVLVLLDYLLPVDWLAYLGYALFAVFVGATASVIPTTSFLIMAAVFAGMLLLHVLVFSRYLTNAPHIENCHQSKPCDDHSTHATSVSTSK